MRQQSVFIIKADGSELRCTNYIHNTASKQLFYIPDSLTVAEVVELEVRNNLNNSVNDVRSGRLAIKLNVV